MNQTQLKNEKRRKRRKRKRSKKSNFVYQVFKLINLLIFKKVRNIQLYNIVDINSLNGNYYGKKHLIEMYIGQILMLTKIN